MNKGYCKDCIYYGYSKYNSNAICLKVEVKRPENSPDTGIRVIYNHISANVNGECQYYEEKE